MSRASLTNPPILAPLAPHAEGAIGTLRRHGRTAVALPKRGWRRLRQRRLSLALQGGGAFGAFTWGVLDRLLEDDRLVLDGISGASAGALNAAVMASGWLEGGHDGARSALNRLWRRTGDLAGIATSLPTWGVANAVVESMARWLTPGQANPFDLNPMRAVLRELVDIDRLRAASAPRLFIAATHMQTGRPRIFTNPEISIDALLASACLPQLQRAVTVDGEAYWDGGYSSNPPLVPLVEHCDARHVLLVRLVPTASDAAPTSNADIAQRINNMVFNTPLLRELEALDTARRATRGFGLAPRFGRKVRRLRLHTIDAGDLTATLSPSSAMRPDWPMLERLRDRGRDAAARWLAGETD
jgi:NTE family protein